MLKGMADIAELKGTAIIEQSVIEDAIRRALPQLKPDVVKIGYKWDEDWYDSKPILSYRVVLKHQAYSKQKERKNELPHRVRAILNAELDPMSYGILDTYYFRTDRSAEDWNDPEWIGNAIL
jgi:hypothetical protein